MKQISFADAEYAEKRKQTRRERFLVEMEQVLPWRLSRIIRRVKVAI
jgi:IS5 family transposase